MSRAEIAACNNGAALVEGTVAEDGRSVVARRFLAIAAVGVLTGCAGGFEPTPTITRMLGEHTISNTASLSNTYVVDRGSSVTFCSQPPPDAGFTQQQSGDFNVSLVAFGGGSDAGNESTSQGELEMDGRSPSVLLSRELLYRLCEFSRNNELSNEQAMELYRINLEIIGTVSAIEARNTRVLLRDTLSESENVSATESMTESTKTTVTETEPSVVATQGSQGEGNVSSQSFKKPPQCSNNIDDDKDGDIDLNDQQCESNLDDSEDS